MPVINGTSGSRGDRHCSDDFEVARMSRFGFFWHFKALNAMAPVFMRMLISAWTNGEPASWYAMRFGLPETESVCIFHPLGSRKLRSMKCPFGFDVRPIPAGWGGYIRSTADLRESPI
jgi:hypothetical protein